MNFAQRAFRREQRTDRLRMETAIRGTNSPKPTLPPTPIFSLFASKNIVEEGETITFSLSTTNVPDGTVVPYQLTGIGIQAIDFVAGSSLTGNFIVNHGEASVQYVVRADAQTEGNEILIFTLTGLNCPPQAQGINVEVTIVDTSVASPDYTLFSNKSVYNEGEVATFTLETEGVLPNEIIPFSVTGNIETLDLNSSHNVELTGLFVIDTSGKATVAYKFKEDLLLENTEELTLTLTDVGTYICPPQAKNKQVTVQILDTSYPVPQYYLTVDSLTANETTKTTIKFSLSTENIREETLPITIPFKITGTIDSTDFVGNPSLTGTFLVSDNNTVYNKFYNVIADSKTEGNETMSMVLTSVGTFVCPIEARGKQQNVLIYDTSTFPPGYTLSFNPGEVNETNNNEFQLVLTTTGVNNNTIIPFRFSGTGIQVRDLSGVSALSGVFVVTGATNPFANLTPVTTSLTYKTSADKLLESTETLTATLTSVGSLICPSEANGKKADLMILDTSVPNRLYNSQILYSRLYWNPNAMEPFSRSAHSFTMTPKTFLLLGTYGSLPSSLTYSPRVAVLKADGSSFTRLQEKDSLPYSKSAINSDGTKMVVVKEQREIPSGGFYYYSDQGGVDWPEISNSTTNSLFRKPFPINNKIKEMFFKNDSLFVLFANGTFYKTANPISPTWEQIASTIPGIVSMNLSQTGPTLICCTSNSVYVSEDNGNSWINQNLTENDFISVTISNNGQNKFALTKFGKFYRKIGNNSWSNSIQLPFEGYNNSFAYLNSTSTGQYLFAKNRRGIMYTWGTEYLNSNTEDWSSRILVSSNFGETWNVISLIQFMNNNLSKYVMNGQLFIDPDTNQLKLFATDGTRPWYTANVPE